MDKGIPTYRCPSSPVQNVEFFPAIPATSVFTADLAATGGASYRAAVIEYAPALNIAPPPMNAGIPRTPAFLPQISTRGSSFAAITDGLSNTMMFGELSGGPVRYNQKRQAGSQSPNQFHLGTWARLLPLRMSDDGMTLYGGNCLINCTNFTGLNLYSFHAGAVNIALADGSVRAVTNSISMDTYYRLVAINDGLVVGEY